MEKEIGFLALIALVGYLVGSFPTGYIIVRRFAGKNILEWGTGNVGTLNTLRATNSKLLTLATLSGDVLKGIVALVVGYSIARAGGVETGLGAATGGIMAVVGHNYTVFLKFQGGKGIATSLPVLFYLAPLLVVLWLGVFFLTVATTRLLVLGQILGTVAVPIVGYLLVPDPIVPVSILALLVFIRHASRIRNIVKGTEPKLYYKAGKS